MNADRIKALEQQVEGAYERGYIDGKQYVAQEIQRLVMESLLDALQDPPEPCEKEPRADIESNAEEYWTCKIGPMKRSELPSGSDLPMRRAVQSGFRDAFGRDGAVCFSGWGAALTRGEQSVVDHRSPLPIPPGPCKTCVVCGNEADPQCYPFAPESMTICCEGCGDRISMRPAQPEPCKTCVGSYWGPGALDDPLSSATGGRPYMDCPDCNPEEPQ